MTFMFFLLISFVFHPFFFPIALEYLLIETFVCNNMLFLSTFFVDNFEKNSFKKEKKKLSISIFVKDFENHI